MDHFGSSKVKSDASVAPNRPLIKEKPNLRAAHAPFGRGSLWYTTACNSPTFCFMMHVPRDLNFFNKRGFDERGFVKQVPAARLLISFNAVAE
jgi:hypothetical protein